MTHSPLANPRATREVLDRFGLRAKYSFGQNFLVDDNVIGKIIHLAALTPGKPVLEIGPGIGTLTLALLDQVPVIAVEHDADLVPVLAHTTEEATEPFTLIQADALRVVQADIVDAADRLGCGLPTQLVSNLPYAIAATVILGWFQSFGFLDSMTVMVQSEVADRIAARVGTKDYGAYSIKLGLRARVMGRFQVPPSCFLPAPRVESAVIRLERHPLDDDPAVLDAAARVADGAFAQRRKTIRNSLCSRFDKGLVDRLLADAGVEPTVRAETLTPETFVTLGRCLLELL